MSASLRDCVKWRKRRLQAEIKRAIISDKNESDTVALILFSA